MNRLDRREIVRTSGAAIAVSLFGNSTLRAIAQADVPPAGHRRNSYHSAGVYSQKLAQSTTNTLQRHAQAIYEGTAVRADYLETARSTRMFAKHLQDSGTDTRARKFARTNPPPALPANYSNDTYNFLKIHIPSLQQSDVDKFTIHSSDELSTAHATIATQGVSSVFHTYADNMFSKARSMPRGVSNTGGASSEAMTSDNGQLSRLMTAEFPGGTPLHLRYVQKSWCQEILDELCDVAKTPAAQSAAAAGVLASLGPISLSADAICTAILVGSAAIDIVTDGIGLSLTGLEVALCDAAELAAATAGIALSTPFNTLALGAIVATAIDSAVKSACGA